MIARRALLAAAAALAARPAFAIDPGTASGGYRGDDASFDVSHAVALAIDNAEGLNDDVRMRLVLSDVEVLPSALCGIAFPPVWGMARAAKLRGLLVEFDPADRTKLTATTLAPPEPGYSLGTTTLSHSEGLWARLDASPTRISGELKPDVSDHIRAAFSAPVFTNAVVADLKGPAAQASEPVKVLLARIEALQKGDIATAKALSTESAGASFDKVDPKLMAAMRGEVANMVRELKSAKRVVIRRETAAVILDKSSWANTALVDGRWKVAD